MNILNRIKITRYCLKHQINFFSDSEIIINGQLVRPFTGLLEYHTKGRVSNFNDRSRLRELKFDIFRSISDDRIQNENRKNEPDFIILGPNDGMIHVFENHVTQLCDLYEFETSIRGTYITGTDRYSFADLSTLCHYLLIGSAVGIFMGMFV